MHRDAREKERERDRERRREGVSEGSRGSMCAKCGLPMTGQFVRALGTVYHLDCFRCQVSFLFLSLLFRGGRSTPRRIPQPGRAEVERSG